MRRGHCAGHDREIGLASTRSASAQQQFDQENMKQKNRRRDAAAINGTRILTKNFGNE